MILHYLKIVIRSIFREKIYSVISILGLGIGVMCSLLFLLWVRSEMSYDTFHTKASQIYRVIEVEQKEGNLQRKSWISDKYAKGMKQQFPEIEAVTYLTASNNYAYTTQDNKSTFAFGCKTNKEFFNVFDFKFIEGSAENCLQSPSDIVISSKVAKALFGNESAIGKEVSNYNKKNKLTVTAVVEVPINTHVFFEVLQLEGEYSEYGTSYILVNKNAQFTDDTRAKMANYPATLNSNSKAKLMFQPLTDMHLHSEGISVFSRGREPDYGNIRYVVIFSIAALLVLLIAIINYVNIATARSANKTKEVGVRKVLGASRKQLVIRFLFESITISTIAVIIALCLVELVMPQFSSLMGTKIIFEYNLGTFGIALCICLFTGILSGLYAALYLSSFNPIKALKGASQTGSKDGLRKILLGVQFTLSITIMICTLIVYKQLDFIVNKDLGFDRQNVLRLDTGVWYEVYTMQQELLKNPNIINSTMATGAPYNVTWGFNDLTWGSGENQKLEMAYYLLFADGNFAKTFGIELVKGRFINYIPKWWEDESNEYNMVLINETLQKYMGVDDPIGMEINGSKIIGVVKDFHFRPFQEAISPLLIKYNGEELNNLYIKISPNDQQNTIKYIEEMYNKFRGDGLFQANRPFLLTYVEDEYRDMYKGEFRLMRILGIFAVISLFISCMGVVGMVMFMVERRSKEIAIRKINGAMIGDIMRLFIREFVILIGIAALVASPIALWLMANWLNNYVYRIGINPLYFIIVIAFTLFITLLTLSIQIYRAARRNPVTSLRNE